MKFYYLAFLILLTGIATAEESKFSNNSIKTSAETISVTTTDATATIDSKKSKRLQCIIIDIKPKVSSINKTLTQNLPSWAKQVRIVNHDNFYRVRIDLQENSIQLVKIEKSDHQIIFTTAVSDKNISIIPTVTTTPLPTKLATINSSVTKARSTPSPTLTSASTIILPIVTTIETAIVKPTSIAASNLETVVPTHAQTPISITQSPLITKVFFTETNLSISYSGDLKNFEVQELGEISANKLYAYKIVIPQFRLENATNLTLPYFAPTILPHLIQAILSENENQTIINIVSDSNSGIAVNRGNNALLIASK